MRRVLADSWCRNDGLCRLRFLSPAQMSLSFMAKRRTLLAMVLGHAKPVRLKGVTYSVAALFIAVFGLSVGALSQTPSITSLSATSGTTGTSLTVNGTNFGGSQGTSAAKFNGVAASISSWNNTQIGASVPSSATTGPVTVTVGSNTSNGVTFAVIPSIGSLSPSSGSVSALFTVYGTGFGSTKGTSSVSFNSIVASASSWSTTQLIAQVPAGAVTGPVTVTVGGNSSNSATFTVLITGSVAGHVTQGSNGNPVSGA